MENVTRVLLVSGGDDYHANTFENKHGGVLVKDILDNIQEYISDDYDLEVKTFEGIIDPNFIKFIRQHIQDYDQSKTTNFYMEYSKVGERD